MISLILLLQDIILYSFIFFTIKEILKKFDSIRALATIMISLTFCYLSITGKIVPKDVLLITSLVYNFYFLVKDRKLKKDN